MQKDTDLGRHGKEDAKEETAKGKAGDTVLERYDPYQLRDVSWVGNLGCE